MTTEVERTYEIDAPVEAVWEFIADDELRAEAISFVDDYEVDGDAVIWKLGLPIPAIPGFVHVRTRDVERREPTYVKFVGISRIMDVEGEHELTETDEGCRVRNRFVVTGHLPGVEGFFKRNIDSEIDRLLSSVAEHLRQQSAD